MAWEQAANSLLFMNGFQASSYPHRKSRLEVKQSESVFREAIIPILLKQPSLNVQTMQSAARQRDPKLGTCGS